MILFRFTAETPGAPLSARETVDMATEAAVMSAIPTGWSSLNSIPKHTHGNRKRYKRATHMR